MDLTGIYLLQGQDGGYTYRLIQKGCEEITIACEGGTYEGVSSTTTTLKTDGVFRLYHNEECSPGDTKLAARFVPEGLEEISVAADLTPDVEQALENVKVSRKENGTGIFMAPAQKQYHPVNNVRLYNLNASHNLVIRDQAYNANGQLEYDDKGASVAERQ